MVRFGFDPRQDTQARLSALITLSFHCADRECQAIKNYISETSIIPLVASPWCQGGGRSALPLLRLSRLGMIEGHHDGLWLACC
jgi:hypothetical protein